MPFGVVHILVTYRSYADRRYEREAVIVSPGRKDVLKEADRDPLPGLKKQLSEEYEDQPKDSIDQAAEHGLDRFANARVRAFVGIFAWRHAREHLRRAS